MIFLILLIWFTIGFFVVRRYEPGTVAMLYHNYPWVGLLLLFVLWLTWPGFFLGAWRRRP